MKKTFAILLAAILIFSSLSVSTYALTGNEIAKNYDFALNVAQKDDQNNIIGYTSDGKVTLEDARAVLRVSAGLDAPREGFDYDIDGDGLVTVTDVKTLISIILGIDVSISDDEYLLSLFKTELNSIKTARPGFTKTATTKCHSMLVTTKNAPEASLNVTNMEFDVYTNKTCDYMDELLNGAAAIFIPAAEKAEMKAQIATLRKQAKEMYDLKTTTKVVNRYGSHYYHFPVNNLGNSCFLELSDIKSIECYEEGNYIIRIVKMNEDTYIGDQFPTGNEGFTERWKTIPYGKVFNIPDFDETEGTKETSVLNRVTFKDGVIKSTVDKLSGVPVKVEYSYSYVADVSTIPEIDKEGKPGLQMDSVTSATNTETFVINPVTIY